jgi:hypothetical protein
VCASSAAAPGKAHDTTVASASSLKSWPQKGEKGKANFLESGSPKESKPERGAIQVSGRVLSQEEKNI